MTLFQITRHECWKSTREPRRPQESDTMLQTAQEKPHAFSRPPKMYLGHAKCTSKAADLPTVVPRLRGRRGLRGLRGLKTATCVFTASQNASKPCPPSPGHKGPQDSHMRFHSVPERIWVMPSAPRQQTYTVVQGCTEP